jgi:D-lactate dehydrogenase (cytochrome)
MRNWVKSLKMVLAGGDVLELRRGENFLSWGANTVEVSPGRRIAIPLPSYVMPEVKSSAGYFAKDGMDLIDLFIGHEGTLSVITEVELGLAKMPERIYSCFVFFKRMEDALGFSAQARRSDALSIEYFDRNSLRLLMSRYANIPEWAQAAVFFEQDISDSGTTASLERWTGIIERYNASIEDTWFAEGASEVEKFAEFRHAVPDIINDTIRRRGFRKLATDIAVPEDNFSKMMEFYVSACGAAGIEYAIFGHIGECHLHVNIMPRTEAEFEKGKDICLEFVRKGVSLGGTVSAEHGIGKIKHAYLEEMYGRKGILEMARVKKVLDPDCILGLDNIFPRELLKEV